YIKRLPKNEDDEYINLSAYIKITGLLGYDFTLKTIFRYENNMILKLLTDLSHNFERIHLSKINGVTDNFVEYLTPFPKEKEQKYKKRNYVYFEDGKYYLNIQLQFEYKISKQLTNFRKYNNY